jgi:hypothetical protein
MASAVSAVVGWLLWVGGCYLLFVLTAPSEVGGPPQLVLIVLTLGTSFAGSIVAGAAVHLVSSAVRMVNAG